MGILSGSQSFTGLTIIRLGDNTMDQDFYRWVVGASGTLSVTLSNILSNGDIQFRLYKVNADNTLSEIASGTNYGGLTSQAGAAHVDAGENVILYVFGFNFAVGSYDMTVALS